MAKDTNSWLARYHHPDDDIFTTRAAGRGVTIVEALAQLWLKLQEAA